jgi:hypothetical protein
MKFCKKEKGCLEPNQNQLFNMENQNYFYFQKDHIRSSLGESLSYIYIYISIYREREQMDKSIAKRNT